VALAIRAAAKRVQAIVHEAGIDALSEAEGDPDRLLATLQREAEEARRLRVPSAFARSTGPRDSEAPPAPGAFDGEERPTVVAAPTLPRGLSDETVWPVEGRKVLRAALDAVRSEGTLGHAAGGRPSLAAAREEPWVQEAGAFVFRTDLAVLHDDDARGRVAMIAAVRRHVRLGSLALPGTTFVLSNEGALKRVWTIFPKHANVAELLDGYAEGTPERARVARGYAAAMIHAMVLAFRDLVAVDGRPERFVERDGVVHYVGATIREGGDVAELASTFVETIVRFRAASEAAEGMREALTAAGSSAPMIRAHVERAVLADRSAMATSSTAPLLATTRSSPPAGDDSRGEG
jgi:hypothetical protein